MLSVLGGFSAVVGLQVLSKLVCMVIHLPTLLTWSCHMSFLMLCKLMAVTKGLPTLLTLVGFLSCMNSLMLNKA